MKCAVFAEFNILVYSGPSRDMLLKTTWGLCEKQHDHHSRMRKTSNEQDLNQQVFTPCNDEYRTKDRIASELCTLKLKK